ncbi:hypothetical protein ACE6H2_006438 [Prunus campanulata]
MKRRPLPLPILVLRKVGMVPGGNLCRHTILRFRMLQIMLLRASSKGLILCFLMSFKKLFTLRLREQVIEEHAKFNMLLKLKRGDKEEKFKVEVHKNNEGAFKLNQMEADHS